MVRYLKLTAYLLFGFFLYEVFRGIRDPRPARSGTQRLRKNNGGFKSEPVSDSSGAQNTHKVGRGVIS